MNHCCTFTGAGRLAAEVGDLGDVQSQLGVLARVLVLHIFNDSLVSVVLGSDEPEIVQALSVSVTTTKHVESFLELTTLVDFLLREDSLVDPHATLKDVFLQLTETCRVLTLGPRRRVPVTRVREHSSNTVPHARANRVYPGLIVVFGVNRCTILGVRRNHLAVHNDTCADPLLILDVEQIEIVKLDPSLTIVTAVDEHEGAEHS